MAKNIKMISLFLLIPFSLCAMKRAASEISDATGAPTQETLDKELVTAVERQNVTHVKNLLAQGADANARIGELRDTALHRAVRTGSLEVVQELLSWPKIQIDAQNGRRIHYVTPLHLACGYDTEEHCRIVDMLLAHGADINIRINKQRETMVMWAAQHRKLYMLELLIKKGADVWAQDSKGRRALDIAEYYVNPPAAQMLAQAMGRENYQFNPTAQI